MAVLKLGFDSQRSIERLAGLVEVAEAPVGLSDVMDCGGLIAPLAVRREFLRQALELREGALSAVFAVSRDCGFERGVQPRLHGFVSATRKPEEAHEHQPRGMPCWHISAYRGL